MSTTSTDLAVLQACLQEFKQCRRLKCIIRLTKSFPLLTLTERKGHYDIFYDSIVLARNVSPHKDFKGFTHKLVSQGRKNHGV